MKDQRPRVVVVGSINADLTLTVDRHPQPGETLTGSGGDHAPGGKGANQALAAALAGAPTALVGAVGDDANADVATGLLRQSVDLTAVTTVPGPTGLAVITVDGAGENTIIVLPGANAMVSAEAVRGHEALIAGAEVVICQCEIPAEAIAQAARITRGRFILNVAPATRLPREVLRRADPLVVNEHEARALLEHLDAGNAPSAAEDTAEDAVTHNPVADDGAARVDHAQVAARIRRHGIGAVVITLGAAGALVADDDGVTPVPSPSVQVVDTTGAGDAFVGVLGAHLAQGADLRFATAIACRAGALATIASGAQSSYAAAFDALGT